MKILGIDTTTKFLSLGVYDNGKIYEYNLDLGRRHSSLLILTIKRVLEALGWRAQDIDYFACGLGPGSFTGIRVGIAAIKGLALSLNKPVAGISTLDIVARNSGITNDDIVPIIDAKRQLLYCSVYKINNGTVKRIMPYMLLTERELLGKIKSNAVLMGDAVNLYREKILANIKGATVLDKDCWYPKGRNIVELALERIKNKQIVSAFGIKPIYLYPKECQIRK